MAISIWTHTDEFFAQRLRVGGMFFSLFFSPCSDATPLKRVSASGESLMRCKLSVIAEAVAQCTEAVPFTSLQPYEDHFHPTRIPTNSTGPETKRMKNRKVGNPFQAINIVPLEHQLIGRGKLDQWDFCLRNLFVKKATALKGAMRCVMVPKVDRILFRAFFF